MEPLFVLFNFVVRRPETGPGDTGPARARPTSAAAETSSGVLGSTPPGRVVLRHFLQKNHW